MGNLALHCRDKPRRYEQAGADVQESLSGWAKQQEAALAEDQDGAEPSRQSKCIRGNSKQNSASAGGSLEHRLSVKKRISQGDNSQLVRLAWHILGQDEVDRLRKALEEARR